MKTTIPQEVLAAKLADGRTFGEFSRGCEVIHFALDDLGHFTAVWKDRLHDAEKLFCNVDVAASARQLLSFLETIPLPPEVFTVSTGDTIVDVYYCKRSNRCIVIEGKPYKGVINRRGRDAGQTKHY